MLAAGATEGDGQPAPALLLEARDKEVEEIGDLLHEALRDGLGEHEVAHLVVETVQRSQAVDVERVLHEADVEDDVSLEGDAVLVAEADKLDSQGLPVVGQVKRAVEPLAQLASGELRSVDDYVRLGADLGQQRALAGNRRPDAAIVAVERM